jgi:ATP-dependent helicase/nuclease subunit A
MTVPLRHTSIRASAGSGKTFELAHMFLRLLARDRRPERICALTFSRKAAGEIFESILRYLAQYAASDEGAQLGTERLGLNPPLSRSDFLDLLRLLIARMPRLHVGTLDSFIIGIVRAFPLELGLGPLFSLANPSDDPIRQVYADLTLSATETPQARTPIRQSLNRLFFGEERKSYESKLVGYLGKFQTVFRLNPTPEAWGDPATIWPGTPAWRTVSTETMEEAGRLLQAALPSLPLHATARKNLLQVVDFIRRYGPDSPWENKNPLSGTFAQKLFDQISPSVTGDVFVEYSKKAYCIPEPWARAFRVLLDHLLKIEFEKCLQRTQGLYHLLRVFENHYQASLRQTGRMTFEDAQFLVAQAGLTENAAAPNARLYIDYRLDGGLDHWLLDEFQDTSDIQWEILKNLVDEVISDTERNRLFFFVGDVKQAIYGWRGGNSALFQSILDRYGANISAQHRAKSFRCAPAVISTVNQVFAHLPEQTADEDSRPGFPRAVCERWRQEWQDHQSARTDHPGYAALWEMAPGEPDSDDDTAPPIHQAVVRLLRDVAPLRRGLTVGILVRQGKTGLELAHTLRRELPDMPLTIEGKSPLLDNPASALLVDLLRGAAHPGDTLARQHVAMSPLHNAVPPPAKILDRLAAIGFREWFREWTNHLAEKTEIDPFTRIRLDQLTDLAGDYDLTGRRDIDAFLSLIENQEVDEAESAGSLRLMTIHKSKGLEFDLVILPDLGGTQSMSQARTQSALIHRNSASLRPEWSLLAPHKDVVRRDPVLNKVLQEADESAAFEQLCVLYVAMTRAKSGLYLLIEPPGKSFTPAALLTSTLSDPTRPVEPAASGPRIWYENGPGDWYTRHPILSPATPPSPVAETPSIVAVPASSAHPRLERQEPSRQEETLRKAVWLFDPINRDVLLFGSALHELMAQLEWADTADPTQIVQAWPGPTLYPPAVCRDAVRQFQDSLARPDIRRSLSRPESRTDCELWREKGFDVVLEGKWVSGKFDRVVMTRNAQGEIEEALILDFKTNRITAAETAATAAHYVRQMETYRQALARLIRFPAPRIRCILLFTHPGTVFAD